MNQKPNVLMINVDHWPAALMGYAGNTQIMTPTMDALAKGGISFTNFYSTCPVCIPARRSLMTGLSTRSHGDRVFKAKLPMPDATTLAQAFRNQGYQAYAVGKLHVYPQRDRIGFDDVILQEEGRIFDGAVDDYQIWLGDQGYAGQEFMHGMGNNSYYTRTWHLPEYTHPTNWATDQMVRQIKRKDPTRPAFYYISYQHPHPPLAPPEAYWNMYQDGEIDDPVVGDWLDDSFIMQTMTAPGKIYTKKEMRLAKRAFYALITHIDHQMRVLFGTLRDTGLLENTIVAFTSDHGDMLFDHDMVAKRAFYEGSANIPLVLSGRPLARYSGTVDTRLGCHEDIMPTLLELCGIAPPSGIDGISLVGDTQREMLYGEISEGNNATRMVRDDRYKLIYYPAGNVTHLFDMQEDPNELRNIAMLPETTVVWDKLTGFLISNLYGGDEDWVVDGKLVGFEAPLYKEKHKFEFQNQRGLLWPPPVKG